EEDLRIIAREVKRLEQTVQSFLDFARLPTPTMAPCDLRDIVVRAWELVAARARQQGVELKITAPEAPVVAAVDAGQMATVLVNLFLNALDVMGPSGLVEVRLSPKQDRGIALSVLDSGPGIPEEVLDHLFQPFATNKPHGTGLGLYVSARILEEHGGSLKGRHRPGGRACLTLKLPPAGAGVPPCKLCA